MTFNPATLPLTGWWRADFSPTAWGGIASAGTSGSHTLDEVTLGPTAGTTQNGKVPADFSGTQQIEDTTIAISNYASVSAWSVAILFLADTATADAGATNAFANPGFFGDTGQWFGAGFSSSGICGFSYDGIGSAEIRIACATGAYHLAQFKLSGGSLFGRLDNGTWTSVATGNIGSLAGFLNVGTNWNASAGFDGRILDFMMSDTALSDADFNGIGDYVQGQYALNLGFTPAQQGMLVGQRPFRGVAARGPVRHLVSDTRARVVTVQPFVKVGITQVDAAGPVRGPVASGPIRRFNPSPLARQPGDAAPFLARGSFREARRFGAPNRDGVRIQFPATVAYSNPTASTSPIAGTDGITFAQTGALLGDGVLAGSSSIAFGQSATVLGVGDVAGSTSIIFAQTGALLGTGAAAGSTSITFAQTGAVLGAGAAAGTNTILFGQAGTMLGAGALASTNGFTFAQTGALLGTGALAGTDAITFTQAGTLSVFYAVGIALAVGPAGRGPAAAGPIRHFRSARAFSSPQGPINGTSSILFAQTGALLGAGVLAASNGFTFAQTGALLGAGALLGSTPTTFGQSGTLLGKGVLAGSSAATFGQTGALLGSALLAALAPLTFGQSGTALGKGALAGSVPILFDAQGALSAPAGISGSVAFSISVNGTLTNASVGQFFVELSDRPLTTISVSDRALASASLDDRALATALLAERALGGASIAERALATLTLS